jgi:hypothetical protein
MDVIDMKAKIAAGVLPQSNRVAAHHVRYASGLCVGCDVDFGASEVGVQIFASGKRRLLHADCYVMWTEVCAETVAALALCPLCGRAIHGGAPRYHLGGGVASVHINCRDTIKPQWPRPQARSNGASARPAA